METRIVVQSADFDVGAAFSWLAGFGVGATCIFTGLVRSFTAEKNQSMLIEHYPGMLEQQLQKIVDRSGERWPLQAVMVIHRYGVLHPGDNIVLVGTGSDHRAEALNACSYIMDFLKTDAPLWKKEIAGKQANWVEQQATDSQRRNRW